MAVTLPGCVASQDPKLNPELRAYLPHPPADFGKAVGVPKVVKGKDARVLSAEALIAIGKANRRLRADGDFYAGVEREFGANK